MIVFGTAVARAQLLVPFLSKAGYRTALTKAKDSLGADARLAFVATVGSLEQSGFTLEFNLENGQATAWVYTFYSPSQSTSASLGVVQIPILGFQTQSIGQAIPLPPVLSLELDTTGTYVSSDRMIAQLKTDTTYSRYHMELPGAKPTFVTLGQLVQADSANLPNGYPLDEASWTLLFRGGGDSTMTCFVSSKTGAHFCRRISLPPLGVPQEAAAIGTASLTVLPNPAASWARVLVALPAGARTAGATCGLYDERGTMVMDLSSNFAANHAAFVDVDVRGLAAGAYYCRAAGSNWVGTAGVVVEK